MGLTVSSVRRQAKVGVKSSSVVKEHRKSAKPITPTKLKASFHCQTWLVGSMGLGAPKVLEKKSQI